MIEPFRSRGASFQGLGFWGLPFLSQAAGAVKKYGSSGLARTLRCAFSGVIASLADLKGLRQPNFSHLRSPGEEMVLTPSRVCGTPSAAQAGEGKGEREGASIRRPTDYVMSPAAAAEFRAEFLNELLTQETLAFREPIVNRWRVRLASSPASDGRAPFRRAHVPNMPREKPVMAFKVFHSVLPFAVFGLVQILHNPSPSRLGLFKVCINIIDEYCEALSLVPELRGASAPRPRAVEHYPNIAEMHLRAVDLPACFAVSVVLGETECVRQPNQRSSDILIPAPRGQAHPLTCRAKSLNGVSNRRPPR